MIIEMHMKEHWSRVRAELGVMPVAKGMVSGQTPLFVERYFFRSLEKTVKGIDCIVLLLHLGGARVREGPQQQLRGETLPGQSILVPPRCETHWHYSGPVDFAIFYFPDHVHGILEGLRRLAQANSRPLVFSDPVGSANALALTEELRKGVGADERFMGLLCDVIFEQTYRSLTTTSTNHIGPQHPHFARLNGVLEYIRDHLVDDLSLASLAAQAHLSVPHFRRLFRAAMGMTVHQFVLKTRIEQARKLLSSTHMPLSRIADECGFSSPSHLTTSFRAMHAATPTEFRAQSRLPSKSGDRQSPLHHSR